MKCISKSVTYGRYFDNKFDLAVVIILISAVVFVTSALLTYFMLVIYWIVGGEFLDGAFFLSFVLVPAAGIILLVLGTWLKVITLDGLGGYGTITGMGIAMLAGYFLITLWSGAFFKL